MVDLNIDLPEGFLEEEVRCGFKVTKQMKEVWAVELDMLDKLMSVCKKHNIKIFASGGTMLGAVRHKGFIPWDDDIDMMMFRDDYEKLCQIALEEFKYPYFFQTEYTDIGSLRGHAQLRNSKTTGILKDEEKFGFSFNQGIFIDIFPLDNVPEDKQLRLKQAKKIEYYKKKAYRIAGLTTRYNNENGNSIKGIIKKFMANTCGKFIKNTRYETLSYQKFEQACQKYNDRDTIQISSLSLDATNKIFYKSRNDYVDLIKLPFEFMSIPVGKNYDHALKQRYGDYMKFVKDGSYHGGVIFDTERSYSEYLK